MPSQENVLRRVDELMKQAHRQLEYLMQKKTISSSPDSLDELRQSAEYIAQCARDIGMDARVINDFVALDGTHGKPCVIAHKDPEKGMPTVLLYAHHDVQPVGNLDGWNTDPWNPTYVNDRIYGRGSADDKAGVVAHLAAIQAALPTGVGVTLFVEGEEEIGSPTFVDFLHAYQDELQADAIIVADSGNWKAGIPALTVSLRGVATLKIRLRLLEHAVHSGQFGGPVLDGPMVMARLLSRLHDEKGNVCVPGLLARDDVKVDIDEEDYRRDSSLLPAVRLAGEGSIASRSWTKPSINLIGMDVTSCDSSSNTIIPACEAVISLRVAPFQNSCEAAETVRDYLLVQDVFGAQIDIDILESGPGYVADTSTDMCAMMKECLTEAFGEKVVESGEGGSIPFIADFQRIFSDAHVFVTGVEDPDARAHSENESLYIPDWIAAIKAEALFLTRLGEEK
ncbi:MAG: M20/M25/M40 family metallo-hydrolase [Actinomycetaceae bacterium]|nr:M20/M25/M40 family metallo-hydrolase [Actinomycetaceae bacterium]